MSQHSEQAATVFIVDDDAAIRFAMQALMDSVNLEHEIFESGDEFLGKITEQRPGCLVLDIRMPGMDGFEILEALKADEDLSKVPVIVITAKELTAAERRRLSGQIEALMEKGAFTDEDLLEEILKLTT